MKPFVVDVYRTDGHGGYSKRRVEAESFEEAKHMCDVRSQLSDVVRMVISRRIGGGGISKMKVWTRAYENIDILVHPNHHMSEDKGDDRMLR